MGMDFWPTIGINARGEQRLIHHVLPRELLAIIEYPVDEAFGQKPIYQKLAP